MTHTACLDANANLSFTWRNDGPLYELKSPGFCYFDGSVRFSHLRLLSSRKSSCVVVHKNCGSGRLKIRRCSRILVLCRETELGQGTPLWPTTPLPLFWKFQPL